MHPGTPTRPGRPPGPGGGARRLGGDVSPRGGRAPLLPVRTAERSRRDLRGAVRRLHGGLDFVEGQGILRVFRRRAASAGLRKCHGSGRRLPGGTQIQDGRADPGRLSMRPGSPSMITTAPFSCVVRIGLSVHPRWERSHEARHTHRDPGRGAFGLRRLHGADRTRPCAAPGRSRRRGERWRGRRRAAGRCRCPDARLRVSGCRLAGAPGEVSPRLGSGMMAGALDAHVPGRNMDDAPDPGASGPWSAAGDPGEENP